MGPVLRTVAEVGAMATVCGVVVGDQKGWKLQRWLDIALWSVASGAVVRTARVGWSAATTPRSWDSPAFYTVARAAVNEGRFYNPETLQSVFDSTDNYFPSEWLTEIGYWYPPPSVLVILPVGLFSPSTGLMVHIGMQVAFLVGSIALLARWFPAVYGVRAYAVSAVLVLSLHPVIETLFLGQIVFGSLLFLVLGARIAQRSPLRAGVLLGVGALFKPLLVIVAVLWAVPGKLRVPVGSILALVGAGVAAAAFFGLDVYRDFIRFGPGQRSAELTLNPVIQSLNGELRRFFEDIPESPGAIAAVIHVPTLVASFIVLAATFVVLRRSRSWADELETACLVVSTGLLLYPNTLFSTLSLLAAPAAMALYSATQGRLPLHGVVALLLGTCLLTSGLNEPFFGLLYFWALSIILVGVSNPDVTAGAHI